MSARRGHTLRRTLLAAGALFAVLLAVFAARMALGRDPALRADASAHRGASAQATAQARAPWQDAVDAVAGALGGAGDEDDEGSEGDGAARSAASPPAVQSTTS
jgi:hypothetical protein